MNSSQYCGREIPRVVDGKRAARLVDIKSEGMEYHVIDRKNRRIIGPWGFNSGAEEYAKGMNAKEKH